MPEKLVTIATFSQPIEAHLAKTKLESEEIQCFVADEHTTRMFRFFSPFIGGIKLQVRESDVERAMEILQQELRETLDEE
ncbi:MAG: DUF2007 domain-containing protein [Terriglobia bacterium]